MKARTGKETGANVSHADGETSTRVRKEVVSANYDGQRIDNFLLTALKGVPKSHIYRVMRTGQVRVNGGRVKANYRLRTGDEVRIPPIRVSAPEPRAAIPAARLGELTAAVIYEDDALLALNKPAGWAVHGGSGVPYGVIEVLREARTDLPHLELVHRLDRDTSGVLLLAKNRHVLRALHDALRDGRVDKHYLALVYGRWPASKRRVEIALRKNVLKSGERMVMEDEDGKEAISEFTVRNAYPGASLVDVKLLTGRTHQIRVHATESGHPLAGDTKYGDAEFNARLKTLGLRRLFLHAHTLAFDSPADGQHITLTAPLPAELNEVLKRLSHAA